MPTSSSPSDCPARKAPTQCGRAGVVGVVVVWCGGWLVWWVVGVVGGWCGGWLVWWVVGVVVAWWDEWLVWWG